jgi:hypothetical protein
MLSGRDALDDGALMEDLDEQLPTRHECDEAVEERTGMSVSYPLSPL